MIPRNTSQAFWRRLAAGALAGLSLASSPACLEAEFSDLDTANGGLLGALLPLIAAGSTRTTYYAFTNQLRFFTSRGNGDWTATTATGPTGGLNVVRAGTGMTLWALDNKMNENLVRSDDGGATWSTVTTGFPQKWDSLAVCDTTVFMTSNVAANWNAVYSHDSGTNWNSSTIASPGAFTIEGGICSDANRLIAIKNTSPPTSISLDGGASWNDGGAVGLTAPVNAAVKPNTSDVLLAYQSTNPETQISNNLTTDYAGTDTTTFAASNWGGSVSATGTAFYVGMRDGTVCNVYASSDGTPSTFSPIGVACANTVVLSEMVASDTRVFFGGTEAGATPRLFRVNLDTGTTALETLPDALGTSITSLVTQTN